MTKTVGLVLLVCLFLVASQLLLKPTTEHFRQGVSTEAVISFFLDVRLWLAVVSVLIGAFIWLYVLSQVPLSTAYPLISFSYVMMIGAAWYFYDEPITVAKVMGVILICGGVYLLFHKAA